MAKQYRNENDLITLNKKQRNNTNHDNEFKLTVPYNFVPLSKVVVRPEWANYISHDIPFDDAQCGLLKLTIEAKQPIFVRNSVSRRVINDNDRKELGSHFSKLDNRYFLPGSSVKGAIRNVLEIMSFGDLSKGMENEKFGMRDLYHEDYKAMFAINAPQKVHCGWLQMSDGTYSLNDCGEPMKVPQKWIDNYFGTTNFNEFSAAQIKMDDFYKSAKKKYELFADKNLSVNYNGTLGKLVFTGQPSANTKSKAKTNEFLFPDSVKIISVEETVVKNFKLAYYDNDKNTQKPDYKYWSEVLRNGNSIPVFFHKDNKGNVASFGLAYMYKIPFTHSVKEAILNHQEAIGNGHDLAECIFGHVDKDNALHGRVTFGHAFLQNQKQPMNKKNEVLNSPKATYYPTYIRQEVKTNGEIKENTYKTLFDKDAVPSGWKRYPVHSDVVKTNPGPVNKDGTNNDKIRTKFRPLESGAMFTCTVNYHNLKKIELGALLSALTFHNTADCFHTLGMAKPLGYGKCKITVDGIDEELKNECLCAFERYMEGKLKQGWLKSEQIQELFTMSQDQTNSGRSELKYMSEVKDFADAKRKRLALDKYTKLDNIKPVTPNKICMDSGSRPIAISSEKESPIEAFERIKKELIEELKNKKVALAEQELAEKAREKRRQQEELRKKSEDARKAAERSAGINLNGVNKNKTIEGLLRTLKRWVENIGGDISERELDQIKSRLSQLYNDLREKDKKYWLEKTTAELSMLQIYLSTAQIQELSEHISQIP